MSIHQAINEWGARPDAIWLAQNLPLGMKIVQTKQTECLSRDFSEVFFLHKIIKGIFNQNKAKRFAQTTAFRCCRCFSLRLLLFLASRVKWLSQEKKKLQCSFVNCFFLRKAVKIERLHEKNVKILNLKWSTPNFLLLN